MSAKLYVGKVFSLKKARIPCHTDPGEHSKITYRRSTEIGNSIVIINESSKRVKVIDNDSKSFWISKFYLAQELVPDHENRDANVILNKSLTNLTKVINSNELDEKISHDLSEVLSLLQEAKTLLEA